MQAATCIDDWLSDDTGGRHYNSEDFNTAGRTIKTGLIAVDVVSHVREHLEVWGLSFSVRDLC